MLRGEVGTDVGLDEAYDIGNGPPARCPLIIDVVGG